jgi:hypothetical protein
MAKRIYSPAQTAYMDAKARMDAVHDLVNRGLAELVPEPKEDAEDAELEAWATAWEAVEAAAGKPAARAALLAAEDRLIDWAVAAVAERHGTNYPGFAEAIANMGLIKRSVTFRERMIEIAMKLSMELPV